MTASEKRRPFANTPEFYYALGRFFAAWSRAASRPSGEWNEDDFDVLANGIVVGRIFKSNASPVGTSWMWTLAFGHHKDRTPHMATPRRARQRWRRSPRGGEGNDRRLVKQTRATTDSQIVRLLR
jgi:hypothetical protein